jgi:hypothetical protein
LPYTFGLWGLIHHLAIIFAYASGDLQTCIYVKKFIDDLLGNHKLSPGSSWSKPANVEALVKAIPDWSTKVPDVAKAVNSGIYDNDCLAHPEVYEFFILF